MCKIAFAKSRNGHAYRLVLSMLRHQENTVAGQSTGIVWHDKKGVHVRKVVGKVINFRAKYPEIPKSQIALGHSRFATVGKVCEDNQHPISIMYNGKRIGWGVHNGTFGDWRAYEHHRNDNLVNKTDSAILFSIYSKYLDSKGMNLKTLIEGLATIRFRLVGDEHNQNFVILFNDGTVIFTGNSLTYKDDDDKIGVMTFGLKNEVNPTSVYMIPPRGYYIKEMDYSIDNDFEISKREVKQDRKMYTPSIPTCSPTSCSSQTKISSFRDYLPSERWIDGKRWKLAYSNIKSRKVAQRIGDKLKQKYDQNYRTVEEPGSGKWSIYILRGGLNE